jgi:hypothetical protein
VSRRFIVLCALVLAANACSLEPDRQWYKPGQSYTVADFRRDETACTKDRKLDEECLRQRGWVALSGDAAPKPKTLEEQERERRGQIQSPGGGIRY